MTDLQKKLLALYSSFKSLCDDNDLRYFAYAGTAIGAIRHKGFIPWDDDIDITMPLPDYKRLLTQLKENPVPNVGVFIGIDKKVSDMPFVRIYDQTSMFTSTDLILEPDSFIGIYIDIFPIIGTPEDEAEREVFIGELHETLHGLWFTKLFNQNTKRAKDLKKKYTHLLNQYDFDSAEIVCVVDRAGLEDRRTIYPGSGFKMKNTPFETTTINIPSGSDEQLTKMFGDYMKMPPKQQRVSNHQSFALLDLDRSYTEYQRLFNDSDDSPSLRYITHLIHSIRSLQQEKFDLLSRIPPLEERIRTEIERVSFETSEKNKYKNPGIRLAFSLLIRQILLRVRDLFR